MTMRARDRLRSLTVADVMTPHVVPISPDSALEHVARLFADKRISSAPVVDGAGACVGMMSAVDIVARVFGSGHQESQSVNSREVMSQHVKSVVATEPLLKAAQVMCANHVHRLPVIGVGERVVGVISTMDIVAAVLNAIDEADAAAFASSNA